MSKPVILTGLRANNDLHIGNYLGGLLPLIDIARGRPDEYDINIFVPDLHSFTTPIEHMSLYSQTLTNLKLYVAVGLPLDNPNIHIYRQSFIPAHSEMTWILDCFTGFGEMSRMTQFKDKGGVVLSKNDAMELTDLLAGQMSTLELDEQKNRLLFSIIHNTIYKYSGRGINASVGLFNYPVLMAADILLYGAKYVPVGDDQSQHLEYTRDIAERMNSKFGELFVVPEPVRLQHEFFGKDQGLRIRDLADPRKKMSKSDETGRGVIFLTDNAEIVTKKIMSATTDSEGKVNYNYTKQPGISNLLDMLALLSNQPLKDVVDEYSGQAQYGPLKQAVASVTAKFVDDFNTKLSQVDEADLLNKLEQSEKLMNERANETLMRVQQAVGLRKR